MDVRNMVYVMLVGIDSNDRGLIRDQLMNLTNKELEAVIEITEMLLADESPIADDLIKCTRMKRFQTYACGELAIREMVMEAEKAGLYEIKKDPQEGV